MLSILPNKIKNNFYYNRLAVIYLCLFFLVAYKNSINIYIYIIVNMIGEVCVPSFLIYIQLCAHR